MLQCTPLCIEVETASNQRLFLHTYLLRLYDYEPGYIEYNIHQRENKSKLL